MVEITVREYLLQQLRNVPVYLDTPPDPADEYVSIEQVGSSRNNMINTYRLAVQSYGRRKYTAAVLNDRVKSIMLRGLSELDEIGSVRLESDYDYTDTETKRYRYQAVFNVVYYDGY
jgi:hypothetical protein